MKKNVIFIVLGTVILLALPIMVNWLASINYFGNLVVGEGTLWISFFSSYLGGILGGVFTLIGVVITIKNQDKTNKMNTFRSNEKNRKVIDNLINRSFSDLLFFLAYDTSKFELKQTDYDKMGFILKRLIRSNQELQKFDWSNINDDFLEEFIRIRELMDILVVSIEEIFDDKYTPKEFQNMLRKINLSRRTITILDNYLTITSEKELIQGVIDDLKKLSSEQS